MSVPSSAAGPPEGDRPRDSIDVSNDDEADFEYEVEPVDEAVLAHQQANARAELKKAEAAIDVDAIYREMDRRDDFDQAFEGLKARFSLKTMLIATTVVAVVLGIGGSGLLNGATFAAFICLSLLGLGSAHAWLNYQDRLRREELIAHRERELRIARGDDPDEEGDAAPTRSSDPFAEVLATLSSAARFSLKDLILATTAAAVMLALIGVTGSTSGAAGALGAVAITGFAMQAADMNVPRPLVIAWWLTLFGFILMTLASLLFGGSAA